MLDMTFGDAADSEAAAERTSARRYRHAGTVLIVAAVVLPLFLMDDAYGVGRQFGGALMALGVLAFIAWLVTRERSELAKGRGRLVVGVLLAVVAIGSAVHTRGNEAAKQFLRDAMALQNQYQAVFTHLDQRFTQLNFDAYVSAEALAAPQTVAQGQTTLKTYRALLQERKLLFKAYTDRFQAFLNATPMHDARRGFESAWVPRVEASRKLYVELDAAQQAQADALGALFAWAQANAGKLTVRNAQLTFQTQQQRAEFLALANKLDATSVRVNAAQQKAAALNAQSTAAREKANKQVDEFLAR